jgi:hypothetical protein
MYKLKLEEVSEKAVDVDADGTPYMEFKRDCPLNEDLQ